MEKRTVLAMILSLIVVIGFQMYQTRMAPPRKPPAPPPPPGTDGRGTAEPWPATTTARPDGTVPAPVSATMVADADFDAPVRDDLRLETKEFVARLTSEGAKLVSFALKDPRYRKADTKDALDLLDAAGPCPALALEAPEWGLDARSRWAVEERAGALVFSRPLAGGGRIEKEVAVSEKPFALDVTMRVSGRGEAPWAPYALLATTAMSPEDEGRYWVPKDAPTEGTIFAVAGIVKEGDVTLESTAASSLPEPDSGEKLERAGNTSFGGAASKYFTVVLVPGEDVPTPLLFLERVKLEIGHGRAKQDNVRSGYRVAPPAGRRGGPATAAEHRFQFFAGPKVDEALSPFAKARLIRLLDFASVIPFAEVLSTLFLAILRKLHGFVGSWGVAIVLLTVIVRVVLHPLSRASIKNMMKMQKLAPKIREIQEKYKGKKSKESAQKMNLEVMELYRSHGTSPLLGCLPTLLQFPVFIGLYNALAYSIELRLTEFLYIDDMSRPDRLFAFGGANIPYLGGYFNILPLVMVVTMVWQQKMQPVPPDPQQQQQAKMMQYMMIFFGVLFYHVPSGLVLYFLTSSLLGMAEQKWVKHQLQADDPKPSS